MENESPGVHLSLFFTFQSWSSVWGSCLVLHTWFSEQLWLRDFLLPELFGVGEQGMGPEPLHSEHPHTGSPERLSILSLQFRSICTAVTAP